MTWVGCGSRRVAFFLAFLSGLGQLFDITGATASIPNLEPGAAMLHDWQRVGDDLRHAMRQSAESLPAESADVASLGEA